MMTALDAIRAAELNPKPNINLAIEGEEEAGSPNLEKILAANEDLFSGDVSLLCDGPLDQTRRQLTTFGSRGISHGWDHGVWAAQRTAQRPLRQLGSESRHAAGAATAHRTPMDLPISQEVIRTVENARGPAVKIPNSGGTEPDVFERTLGCARSESRLAITTTTSTASTRISAFGTCRMASS